jgi:hypothetical protein
MPKGFLRPRKFSDSKHRILSNSSASVFIRGWNFGKLVSIGRGNERQKPFEIRNELSPVRKRVVVLSR